MRFLNKRALVTGGTRGIGRAIVMALAEAGAHVVFTFENSVQQAQEVVTQVNGLGRKCRAVRANSADAADIAFAVQEAIDELGGLDFLINNAGIYRGGPLEHMTREDIDLLLSVNIRAVVLTTREVLPHLERGAKIVNIGSCLADRVAWQTSSVYSMTKSAMSAWTRGLARDLGSRGITVNVLNPGPTVTDMTHEEGSFADLMRSFTATGNFTSVNDIADGVLYLLGDSAANITGTSLTIDGGLNA